MKRWIALILAFVCMFGLVGCSNNQAQSKDENGVIVAHVTATDTEYVTIKITDTGNTNFEIGSSYIIAVSEKIPTVDVGDYIRVVCNPSVVVSQTDISCLEEVSSVDKIEDNFETADFSFVYKHFEGIFTHGERIGLSVELINQQNESYVWTGSQSNYRAKVKLICNNGNTEYSISPEPIPDTDDISIHEVKAGEARSFDFYFTIPIDAITGKYSLVCSFENSIQTFGEVFELK